MPAPDRRESRESFAARCVATAASGRYLSSPRVPRFVQAFTIERHDGVSLMLRVLPGGSWMLREYDCNGDEADRGGVVGP